MEAGLAQYYHAPVEQKKNLDHVIINFNIELLLKKVREAIFNLFSQK